MFKRASSSKSKNRKRFAVWMKLRHVESASRVGSLEQLEERYALAANLITDINTTGNDSRPSQLATVGSISYFKATTPGFGSELWKSDGTGTGTVLVKDIYPGAEGALQSGSLVGVGGNGLVYFVANDGVHGIELWRTDGTNEGTLLVKDLVVGEAGAGLLSLTVIGNTAYFSNATGGLWKSDGTEAGTVLVKSGVRADSFANVNGTLFFRAFDPSGAAGIGYELWKSDGTSAGTVMVKDVNPTFGGSSNPRYLTNVGGTLYFKANTSQGYELWRSDGTEAGTTLVKDIAPGSASSNPSRVTNKDGSLFFIANDGASGYELWKSDGTEAGTTIVKDIRSGAGSSLFQNAFLTQAGGFLFFQADDGLTGRELWKSDGTSEGTVLVKDIYPGSSGGEPSSITEVNGGVYFSANSPAGGIELWASDGTASGTALVRDINTNFSLNNGHSFPRELTNLNGTLLFTAFDSTFGYELWKSDGTTNGTLLVKNIAAGTANSSATELAEVNGTLFFSANDPTRGPELWKTNGTSAGTVLVKEIAPSRVGSTPRNLTNLNGTLLFQATDFSSSGRELWKSDGSSAGTVRVKDISPGPASAIDGASSTAMIVIGNSVFFTATDGVNGYELWKSDGTEAGTVLVKDIAIGAGRSNP
ncbi:MAG: hypothetical protein SFV81_21590, partial [Pirellulaceae bacterium]|nr:hypothetical protein [Pirellulaceae bacterium]